MVQIDDRAAANVAKRRNFVHPLTVIPLVVGIALCTYPARGKKRALERSRMVVSMSQGLTRVERKALEQAVRAVGLGPVAGVLALCGGALHPEHAHFKCGGCGWRDSCCD